VKGGPLFRPFPSSPLGTFGRAPEFTRPFLQGLKPLAKEFSPLRGCGFGSRLSNRKLAGPQVSGALKEHHFHSFERLQFRPFRAPEFRGRSFQGLKPLAIEFSPLRGCRVASEGAYVSGTDWPLTDSKPKRLLQILFENWLGRLFCSARRSVKLKRLSQNHLLAPVTQPRALTCNRSNRLTKWETWRSPTLPSLKGGDRFVVVDAGASRLCMVLRLSARLELLRATRRLGFHCPLIGIGG
jgi:hypothetical protein